MHLAGINLTQFEASGVFDKDPEKTSNQRFDILRYTLKNCTDDKTFEKVIKAIEDLVISNEGVLIPTFSCDFENEQNRRQIRKAKYLVINGQALSLSNTPSPIDLTEEDRKNYTDFWFSESLIEHPVYCSKKHVFEK